MKLKILAAAALAAASLCPGAEELEVANAIASIKATRCASNPLITFASSPSLGNNINGPSVIRVPAWIKDPLGKYYMYFAHHGGKYIRLAYADDLYGPWKIHEPGTLRLEQSKAFKGHVASPDVHVDDAKKQIRMYFHGPAKKVKGQMTAVALSKDGLNIVPGEELLGKFYFRIFHWQGHEYAIAKDWNNGWGMLYRSKDGLTGFEERGQFIPKIRHCALALRGDQLLVFHSRTGEEPERIVVSTVDLKDDWKDWKESRALDVLSPETDYEGIEYPSKPSESGSATNVRQLRDPCIFEEDGKTYLFYSIAGEMGIAMAELEITM